MKINGLKKNSPGKGFVSRRTKYHQARNTSATSLLPIYTEGKRKSRGAERELKTADGTGRFVISATGD